MSDNPLNLQKFTPDLKPERQILTLDNKYHAFIFNNGDTGSPVVGYKDLKTGIVVATNLISRNERIRALFGWAMARYSRANTPIWETLHDILRDEKINPEAKMAETFVQYGHNSVADPVDITIDHANCPMALAHDVLGLSSLYAAQEWSTRYQNFDNTSLHPIENYIPREFLHELDPGVINEIKERYEAIGKLSIENYKFFKDKITRAFIDYYKPAPKKNRRSEEDKSKEEQSLDSRVLDCVRFFLLMGQHSGFAIKASAREWSRIIAMFRASPNQMHRDYAEQIQRLLVPLPEEEKSLVMHGEAPGLIRHTEADESVNNNLEEINNILNQTDFFQRVPINLEFRGFREQDISLIGSEYEEGEKLLAQYILALYPGADVKKLFVWIRLLPDETANILSEVMYRGHNHHEELAPWAQVTGQTLHISSGVGEKRDLFRHRAMGRFSFNQSAYSLPVDVNRVYQILGKGFTLPSYLTEIEEFGEIRDQFIEALNRQYALVYELLEFVKCNLGDSITYEFIMNLLPLAHIEDYWMHCDPKSGLYMPHQRIGNGGLINYRILAYKANQLLASSQRFFSGMKITDEKRPDPKDRYQFFDRS